MITSPRLRLIAWRSHLSAKMNLLQSAHARLTLIIYVVTVWIYLKPFDKHTTIMQNIISEKKIAT